MINTWKEHFEKFYPMEYTLVDATKNKIDFVMKSIEVNVSPTIILINYELLFRRKEFLNLKQITLICDESGLITNENAKRTKFIMKLDCKNIILLSGTICNGKYERLWSQLNLLGWDISKETFWKHYVETKTIDNQGFPIKVVTGYKNVERLKKKMRDCGCRFMKTNEVFDLPNQLFNTINVDPSKEYVKFKKSSVVIVNDIEFVGDTILTQLLYERMLCGSYNQNKIESLNDLLSSTDDRIIIFYNFDCELQTIKESCLKLNKPISIVNGHEKDLHSFDECENSITLVQYQAGSMGLNLQKANKIIYFTPPLSSELFEQSQKRIHRIGQESVCLYYKLIVKNSIEEKIYSTLDMRKDYTNELFKKEKMN